MYYSRVPARGDHDARRRDVSEAVWRVLATRGFGGLTIRAVAAELGASTGLVSHYFPSKRALVHYAHDIAEERAANRVRHAPAAPGLAALRAALLDVLPLTPESVAMSRTWVSFWDAALGDDDLGRGQTARYDRWRAALRVHVEAARDRGEVPTDADLDDLTATAAAFAHGLVVQSLFDEARFPPERQTRLLDRFLTSIGAPHLSR
jgi:AcrR family transcriptional regulator